MVPWCPSEPDVTKLLPSSIFASKQPMPRPPPSTFPMSVDIVPVSVGTDADQDADDTIQVRHIDDCETTSQDLSDSLDIFNQGFLSEETNQDITVDTEGFEPSINENDTISSPDEPSAPYWSGQTETYSTCKKKILKKFLTLHT